MNTRMIRTIWMVSGEYGKIGCSLPHDFSHEKLDAPSRTIFLSKN